jgi:CubicO group peptidase (beta-lactamase class C family)
MKLLRPVIIALAASLAACAAPPLDPGRLEAIDQIVEKQLGRSRNVGFAVGVIDGNRISVRGYGRVSKDAEAKPSGSTVYEIGWISGVFTSCLLADLARDGVVAVNDPIRRHLPPEVNVPRSDNGEITLKFLATHTSGLPKLPMNVGPIDEDPYATYGTEKLYAFLSDHRLRWKVDERYEDSTLGMGLLGHILERAAGKPYEQLVIRRIADPLGMADTRITLSETMKARLAPPYNEKWNPARNWNFQALAGAGALRSTVNDLLRFLSANLGRGEPRLVEVLASCHATRRSISDRLRIGLGWRQSPVRSGGHWVIWHSGKTGGYASWIGFVKESGTAVVVLSNTSGDAALATTEAVATEILGLLNP